MLLLVLSTNVYRDAACVYRLDAQSPETWERSGDRKQPVQSIVGKTTASSDEGPRIPFFFTYFFLFWVDHVCNGAGSMR